MLNFDGIRQAAATSWTLLKKWPMVRFSARGPLGNKGVTAVVFGLSATVVIGFVGLGTEGGAWYLTRRNTQNAADPAAYAGAVRLSLGQSVLALSLPNARLQAIATANDVAAQNGFTSGLAATTVTVNTPPRTGTQTGNNTAVEVIVQRNPPRLMSALFLANDPVIRTRGVAALTNSGPACVLALTVRLTIGGSSNLQMPNCSLASNATGANAININGGPVINATALISSGGCNGCTGLPAQTHQPPTFDPYTALNSIPYSAPVPGTCLPPPPRDGSGTYQVTQAASGPSIFCSNSDITLTVDSRTWNFKPGTYVFWETSLDVLNGSLTCTACTGGAGVTFVFTGSTPAKVGKVKITTNGIVDLDAPGTGTYAGVLIYRDNLGTSSGNPQVQINGGANMQLSGAIYAPTSSARFNGNSATACLILVAAEVDLGGNSAFNNVGCPNPSGVPNTQLVRLVE